VVSALSAFTVSLGAVGFAEIGDKTQLLALALAARYHRPVPLILGIFVATLLNHAGAVGLGVFAHHLGGAELNTIAGLGLLFMAVWMLVPDKEDKPTVHAKDFGVFLAALVTFFLAEMGDKTQIATVALSARFPTAYWEVVAGTTCGMMLANIPAVLFGKKVLKLFPLNAMRHIAAAIYAVLGIFTLISR
jgi:putative Ca2+/H+ antiporter (TMEM165/GDT1 family)